ncbi:hypothetical protein [Gordonia sp. (in: high G+C Gram-positive bacteria)]|uniref:hypothetical protein n=1 Tax=Gordonia sp. (in: high G+C Gram-positive bacteria) TaxID=84139 RepID=UPI0039E439D9
MPDQQPPDRSLRLMSDYSCRWPVWGEETEDELGLSDSLAEDLRDWQEFFNARFHWEDGWSSPDDAVVYERTGRALLSRMHAELPAHHIELDLWPVGEGKVGSWELTDP